MGRGLSELQKNILRIVYERRKERDFEAEERDYREFCETNPYMPSDHPWRVGPDVTNPLILAELYDWPDWWGRRNSELDEARKSSKFRFSGQNFRRKLIGEAEYNRKTAAFYRAVKRLERRGLLEPCGLQGLLITDEGMREAERLMVRSEGGRRPLLTDRSYSPTS